jgi:hypothetical protein
MTLSTRGIHTLAVVGLIASSVFILGTVSPVAQARESSYADRPLRLPHIASKARCPVSIGSNEIISSAHQYIFGAGGYFFGEGPVFLGLAWKPADRAEARFSLVDRMPRGSQGYSLKTPWVMDPEYKGEALVRGARIGSAASGQIVFDGPQGDSPALVLHFQDLGTIVSPAQARQIGAVWGFWPTGMVVPGPGCYALQIDTESTSDIVVFEAVQEGSRTQP